MEKVVSACPLNCWDACSFHVHIDQETVKKVEGNEDHPITKGKICVRGRLLAERTNSQQRIVHPLKKVNGEWIEIEWDTALDEIAMKMTEAKEKYGPVSVMHSHDYSNNGLLKCLDQRFFNCFGGLTEVVGSLCWGAGIAAQQWDFGNSYSHAPDDIENSRQIVIWGRNAASTNMHLFTRLQKIKKKGVPITVIDPIYHTTAKLSDRYVPIKPGMDGWLALGIIKIILENEWEDAEFIRLYTHGFEDLKELISSVSIEEVVRATDVSRETLQELAEVFSSGPTSTFLGLGMQRYQNGGNTIRLIDALSAVSGNVGISGGGCSYGNLAVGESFNKERLTMPDRRKEVRQFTRMNQAEDILKAHDIPVEVLFITRSNPLTQVPDTNVVKDAFTSVPAVVVVDQYMTDSAEIADYFLPCTTVFEEEDIYYASMYHQFINYGRKLVPPKGKAKSDLEIWTLLAERLGFGEDFHYSRDEYLEMGLSSLSEHGITLEKLKTEQFLELPVTSVPWADKKFQTPSGKYEFTSLKAIKEGFNDGRIQLSYPQESMENAEDLVKRYPYQLLTIHPLRSNHSQSYQLIESLQSISIQVSEKIAFSKGISEGSDVEIYNDRGSIQGKAKILKHSHDNVINVDEGQWRKFGGSVNTLTPSRESDIGQGSTFYDCKVDIKCL
ncbi:molybdopterin-dependent oxidoreductase [Bacillus sp. NEB1478]|uniref:molybdopterin-dependent oxidoreductase n=1 Tax=Bacillus sp. NEB1478 TaxID=3073816 RepID=UPI002873E128|nr:molybdopterin-dependent oxidoreductase [Bacillus sp. NEB1478]WNB92097.1 molybdopterin-dependent oxidoreductase [Bacillus sp. NEB1478]